MKSVPRALRPTPGASGRRGVEKSDGRSLAATSLAAETSQFCHCTDVYFWAMQRFRSGFLYTLALVARFLESLDAARRSAYATIRAAKLEFDSRSQVIV